MGIRARLAGLAVACSAALALTAPAGAAPLPGDFFGLASPDSFDASPADKQWLLGDQKAVGGQVLRQIFDWSRIEPASGSFDWAAYDSFMTSTSQAGMDVLANVGWPAAWASRCPSGPNPWSCPPASYDDFGRFVAALIGRYGPEGSFWTANPNLPKRPIEAWQLWNEPNLRQLWGGAANAAEYAEMLKAAAPYIRAADPNAEIVSAGVPNSFLSGAVPMTDYLEGMYAAGAQGSFDTLGLHIYCETPTCSIGLVESARSIMNAHGDEDAPIWVTEMGWASAGRAYRFVTDLEGQAANLGELMGELVARHEELGVRGLVQYMWHDLSPQTNSTDSLWNHVGLTYLDYTHKPAWTAYRSHAIDTAPPDTSVDSGPSGSGNGPSASFGFSSTEAGSDFACSLDGGAAQPCASPQAYTGLADGAHTFSVTATDPHGNADPSPAARSWSVGSSDTTRGLTPAGGGLAPAKPSFAGSPSSVSVDRKRRFKFSFHADPGLSGTAVFRSVKKVRVSRTQRVALASKSFTAPASGRVVLRIRLSKRNFRILKLNRTIRTRITVTLRNAIGQTSKASKTITIKAPKQRRR
jgi:polysaccharide biosynthesis protein PslG